MELERISNDLEHANTVQERKGIIKEFRKTILDSYERNMYEIIVLRLDVQRCAYEKSDTG
jgi:hypothetical protein